MGQKRQGENKRRDALERLAQSTKYTAGQHQTRWGNTTKLSTVPATTSLFLISSEASYCFTGADVACKQQYLHLVQMFFPFLNRTEGYENMVGGVTAIL